MSAATGSPLRVVDAGGGLGIPYSDGERPLDIDRSRPAPGRASGALGRGRGTRARWRWCWSPADSWSGRPAPTWPGSWTSRGRTRHRSRSWTAASTTCCGRHSFRASIAWPSWPRTPCRALVHTTVAGPLCTGLDVFTTEAMLPRPRVGDLVAVLDAGAYGFSRVDAVLPVAPDGRRSGGPRRPGPPDPASDQPLRNPRPRARPRVVTLRRRGQVTGRQ